MYFWNIKALKKDLAINALSEPKVFFYFLAVLSLNTLLFELTWIVPGRVETNIWDYIGYVVSVVFTIGGTLAAYRFNGGASGRDFLTRYFPLMWVLTIRFIVFLVPMLVPLMLLFSFSEVMSGTDAAGDDLTAFSMYMVLVSCAWFLVFYYRLAVHIAEVAHPN